MTTAEIYAKGYAIPLYCISTHERIWRVPHAQSLTITLPAYAVPLHDLPGCKYSVAKWADVQRVARQMGVSACG